MEQQRHYFLYMLVLMSAVLSACSGDPEKLVSGFYKPVPTGLEMEAPEDTPEEYQLGWKHGCTSGLASYGNSYYQAVYKYNYDPKLMQSNALYGKIWQDMFRHCRSYVGRWLNEGITWSNGFEGKQCRGIFCDTGDLRDEEAVDVGPKWFEGADLPGWGGLAWGADAENSVSSNIFGGSQGFGIDTGIEGGPGIVRE